VFLQIKKKTSFADVSSKSEQLNPAEETKLNKVKNITAEDLATAVGDLPAVEDLTVTEDLAVAVGGLTVPEDLATVVGDLITNLDEVPHEDEAANNKESDDSIIKAIVNTKTTTDITAVQTVKDPAAVRDITAVEEIAAVKDIADVNETQTVEGITILKELTTVKDIAAVNETQTVEGITALKELATVNYTSVLNATSAKGSPVADNFEEASTNKSLIILTKPIVDDDIEEGKEVCFGGWSKCSESCGSGIQLRQRSVLSTSACSKEIDEETRACQSQMCPGKSVNNLSIYSGSHLI
jgi:hypothetical protein